MAMRAGPWSREGILQCYTFLQVLPDLGDRTDDRPVTDLGGLLIFVARLWSQVGAAACMHHDFVLKFFTMMLVPLFAGVKCIVYRGEITQHLAHFGHDGDGLVIPFFDIEFHSGSPVWRMRPA